MLKKDKYIFKLSLMNGPWGLGVIGEAIKQDDQCKGSGRMGQLAMLY
ncbi:hypothetical protein [Bacillus norwichensis]|nr:hypothetical protein [Bacillus norwichensis]